jgi:hypothetical protein
MGLCALPRSTCMACRWIQYITAHLQLAQVLPLKILLFERLSVDTVDAMREVLQFLGVDDIDEERLLCATRLADHPLVHRPPANFTMHDAFKSFPEQVDGHMSVFSVSVIRLAISYPPPPFPPFATSSLYYKLNTCACDSISYNK